MITEDFTEERTPRALMCKEERESADNATTFCRLTRPMLLHVHCLCDPGNMADLSEP